MSSVDEELSNKVFNNPLILEYILSYVVPDFLPNFKIRLTNRRFNDACLRVTRAALCKMAIHFKEKSDGYKGKTNKFLDVNGIDMKFSKIPSFFLFLKDVVRLKVEELEVKEGWKLTPKNNKLFHDSIHSDLIGENRKGVRKLVGTELLSPLTGCRLCFRQMRYCQEYGPFDMQSLFNTRYRRCFKRLIVTDQLFDRIANDCVRYSSSKEECYRKLNIFINVPIRCGMLVFWISESRRLNQDDRLPNHHSMPREVFELMIKMWKPQAIGIHFKYDNRIDISRKQWIDSEYFTKVRLNDPYEPFGDDSNLPKLRYVELNLRDSLLCSTDFCFLDPTKTWYRGFDNVIANIRSVFPTDQIIVKGFNMYNYDVEPFSDVFSNLLKIVQKGDNEKLTIKSQFFIDYDPKRADSEQISIQIPKEYTLLDYRSLFYHPELPEKLQERPDRCRMRKWICKKFRFEDEKKNFHFQLNTFLPESVIKLKDVDAGTKSLLSIFE